MVTAGNLIQTNIHITILEHKLFCAFVIVASSLTHTHTHTPTHDLYNIYIHIRVYKYTHNIDGALGVP